MKITTLCYIEHDGQYLMLHRIKKENDINEGKWIGVGGHADVYKRQMKDPYVFDFISFREDMLERDIEQALVRDVTKRCV